jgi:hypothetical protein
MPPPPSSSLSEVAKLDFSPGGLASVLRRYCWMGKGEFRSCRRAREAACVPSCPRAAAGRDDAANFLPPVSPLGCLLLSGLFPRVETRLFFPPCIGRVGRGLGWGFGPIGNNRTRKSEWAGMLPPPG